MSGTIIAGYMIVLIAGGVRTEIRTASPLSLEQCQRLGSGWTAKGQGHYYECRKIITNNSGAKTNAGE